jgi:hypothetical protein
LGEIGDGKLQICRVRSGRGGPRKFTVKTRKQSGCKLTVSNITFTRFTNSIISPDFHKDLYVWPGHFRGLKKTIFGRERGNFEILT